MKNSILIISFSFLIVYNFIVTYTCFNKCDNNINTINDKIDYLDRREIYMNNYIESRIDGVNINILDISSTLNSIYDMTADDCQLDIFGRNVEGLTTEQIDEMLR